jgi:hypothetical protein
MSSINFGFNSKKNNQQKINEYNKKAVLQVQNMVANQKRFMENKKRFMENKKNVALNQQHKSDILKLDVKVNYVKFI